MSIFEQEEKAANDLRAVLKDIAEKKPSRLAREDLNGTGFIELVPLFEKIKALSESLLALDLVGVPFSQVNGLKTSFDSLKTKLERIENLTETEYNGALFGALRQELMKTWRDEIWTISAQMISFCTSTSTVAGVLQSLEQGVEKANFRAGELEAWQKDFKAWFEPVGNSLENAQIKAEQQYAATQELLKRVGAKHHSELFAQEAKSHRKASWCWLIISGLFAGALIWCAVWLLVSGYAQDVKETGAAIAYATNRVLLLSVLSVGLFMSLKNYSACRHNCVVNEHRSNALLTFDTFSNSAKDEETKKAVLLQVMQAIFAPQPTGYLKTADSVQGPQIIEFIKNTVGK